MTRLRTPFALGVLALLAAASAGAAQTRVIVVPAAPGQIAPTPAPTALPRVRLIATGGTISNRTGGRLTAAELLASIPDLDRYVQAEAEQFANIASSSLTLEQWLQLARRVNAAFTADPQLAGVVVTSGTDTLEELAYFLDLTVRSDKPVVVVGSMRNPSTVGYEGAANLLAGLRVAASPDARGKGVLVVLNDEINAARDVTKTDALRLHTFQSRSYGPLGVVDSDRVVFGREVLQKHTRASEFDVEAIDTLPRVDIVMVYQGASGDIIKALADLGARGIVIASAGAGALSGTQGEGIAYATAKGVLVVTSTRTGGGRIAARADTRTPGGTDAEDEPRQARARRIAAEDLSPVKARILLMLALTKTSDPADIQRMFTEY